MLSVFPCWGGGGDLLFSFESGSAGVALLPGPMFPVTEIRGRRLSVDILLGSAILGPQLGALSHRNYFGWEGSIIKIDKPEKGWYPY